MEVWQERTGLMLGEEGLGKLASSKVAVIGTGGVGAVAAEMLARAGTGSIILVDDDVISSSNINRQVIALHSTVGKIKSEVLSARLMDINPQIRVERICEYICEANIPDIIGRSHPDFVVDAIDTLSPKIALIQYCLSQGIPLVSSMGSGAKLDITKVRISDISKTRMCPLAHMLRKRLHKLGINEGFTAVYSEEQPRRNAIVLEESRNKKSQVGTISYLPATFGCACAQVAICRIVGIEGFC